MTNLYNNTKDYTEVTPTHPHHDSILAVFNQGYQAFHDDLTESDNPHFYEDPDKYHLYDAWDRGWNEAFEHTEQSCLDSLFTI